MLRPTADYVNYAYSALAPLGDGMIVVSAAVETDGGGMKARPAADLRAHYCADPRVIDLPALRIGTTHSQGRMLDSADRPRIVWGQGSSPLSISTRLFACADARCGA